jgi:ABC-type antimicrobial peptide transport system permease subunit
VLIVLEPGQAGLLEMGDTVKPTLTTLMGLVALVLLIACANVANLMVARAERSFRETAIALALGATRSRIWTMNLIESLAISVAGLAVGLVFAIWMRGFLLELVPVREQLDVAMDASVFSAAAVLATLTTIVLAAVGLYGVIASAVSRRTKELGVRLALGAAPGGIVRLVLREAGWLVALGAIAGVPCGLLTARAIRTLLFGVPPGDWKSLATALVVLIVVAGIAAWIPASGVAPRTSGPPLGIAGAHPWRDVVTWSRRDLSNPSISFFSFGSMTRRG